MSEVNWTVVEEKKVAIEIGGGIIVLNTKDGESAKFTVMLYSAVDGEAIAEITEEGSSVQIDLYNYESVVKVSISADADATASLYEVAR